MSGTSSPEAPGTPAKSVRKFCTDYDMSVSQFYRLAKMKRAPEAVKIGTRTLIPAEAEARWLASLPRLKGAA